jgi:dihydropteroate synthase
MNIKIMGIINMSTNSFYKTNICTSIYDAMILINNMIQEGVDIIDIGGRATNPYAINIPISLNDEMKLVIPIIKQIRQVNTDILISIDTSNYQIMEAAILAGANIINDQQALKNIDTIKTVSELNIPVILTHHFSDKNKIDLNKNGSFLLKDIKQFFINKINLCLQYKIKLHNIIIDPGLGGSIFGKSVSQNLYIIKNIEELKIFNCPILLGISRKKFINSIILNNNELDILYGSLILATISVLKGIDIIRVHDVSATVHIKKIIAALDKSY